MLVDLPIQLNLGETILHTGEGAHLVSNATGLGFNPYRGQAWVTTQRIIFAHYKGRSTTETLYVDGYPLNAIQEASSIRKKIQFIPNATILKLVFDNGGREYFWLEDPAVWVEIIDKARPASTELPYTSIPPTRTGVEASPWLSFLVALGVIAGILLCSTSLCFLLSVLSQGSR